MKVYVVQKSFDYEGSSIEAVFDTEEKAKEWCKVHVEAYNSNWVHKKEKDKIIKLPFGFKINDVAFTYEEWEVT